MPYDPVLVQPMRDDLTRLGFEELSSAADVDRAVTETKGTLLVAVNSVCGCAAGKARPAPTFGQHTFEVLADAGYTGEEIAKLQALGAIGPAAQKKANVDV